MNRLSGTQLTIIAALFAGVVLLASIAGGDVTNLETIELAQTPTATTYMINPTGVVQYQEYALEDPKRLVIDLVRGKDVGEALVLLDHLPKKGASIVSKTLRSVVANAENTQSVDVDRLYIKSIAVDGGTVMKRFTPRAHGRATVIRKRTSHLTVVVDER